MDLTGFQHLDPYPREIFYCEGQSKEQNFDLQFVPWGWAYSRALKTEMSQSLPFLVSGWGGGGGQWLQMTGEFRDFFSSVSGAEIRPHSQCKLGDFFPNLKKKNPNHS